MLTLSTSRPFSYFPHQSSNRHPNRPALDAVDEAPTRTQVAVQGIPPSSLPQTAHDHYGLQQLDLFLGCAISEVMLVGIQTR
jgi:hypothetical protein